MIRRELYNVLVDRLQTVPVVALLGSRQVGKTTLARSLQLEKPVVYLDAERPSDRAKLADPELYLGEFRDHLVIIDEVQNLPELFPVLRALVDERKRMGERHGHFLLLGSASPELLRQGSETLAGRISYLELPPLQLIEIADDRSHQEKLWVRGGYPDSFLASNDATSEQWRRDFITSYIERYLPHLGVSASSTQIRRLCSMVAHLQASTVNNAQLGNALSLDGKTVRTYLDLLEGLYLIRRIPAWSKNVGKRLVKAAKVQWRDSGLLHSLLDLQTLDAVLGHPICGHSWEAFCIEQIIASMPSGARASYYRTHAGAEIDLVLEMPNGTVHAIEIKRTLSPRLTVSFVESMSTVGANKGTIVLPSGARFPLSADVSAMSLPEFVRDLTQ